MKKVDLGIDFLGVHFENPFVLSSSPVGNCYDMCAKALREGWGGVVFKTIGFFIADEVSPRFTNLRKDNLGFVGFKNMEQIAEHPLEENLEAIRRLKKDFPNKVIIASIMGQNEEEWEKLARLVTEAGADMIELNLSCPQMTSHDMGSDVGVNPVLVEKYTNAVKRNTNLPVMSKMTPNQKSMIPAVEAAMRGGADGVSMINTVKSIVSIDTEKFIGSPVVDGKSSVSGYSGKAVKPIALRFIHEIKSNPATRNVPISGIGGIENFDDALEFLLLGATNLQVTTAIMEYGYRIIEDLCDGLSRYLALHGYNSLQEVVGKAIDNIIPCEELNRDYKVYPEVIEDKCIHCGRCYVSCYDGGHQAISFDGEERKVHIDHDKCVGCFLCANVCPVHAIKEGEIVLKPGRKGDITKIKL